MGGLQESDEMLGLCILLTASASHSEHPLSRGCEEGAAMLARCESPAVLLQNLEQRKQCLFTFRCGVIALCILVVQRCTTSILNAHNITHGFKSIAQLNAGQNGPTNCIL